MGRKKKNSIDYFPHYTDQSGKTIFILEQRYQARGYAFWFKLLEQLGRSEKHYIDFNDLSFLEFFSAKTWFSVTEIIEILDLLAKLNKIDPILWEKRIVWCDNFIENISQVYVKRKANLPEKPIFDTEIPISVTETPSEHNFGVESVPESTQSKVKESKEALSKDKAAKPSHFSLKNGEYVDNIIANCKEIVHFQVANHNTTIFKPYQYVQRMTNENKHPAAILDSLKCVYKKIRDGTCKKPYAYAREICGIKSGNYNEETHIAENAQFKRDLVNNPEFKKLLQSIGNV